MKTKIAAVLAACFWLIESASATITDPVQDFKNQWDLTGVTKIYKLTADINHDGINDVFLSTGQSDPPDDKDYSWQLYIGQTGGTYIAASGQVTDSGVNPSVIPSFNKTQYWIGLIPELNRYGLLHLDSGTGGQALCQLKAIVIEGDGWAELLIGDPVNAEQNYSTLAQRFSATPTPAVVELTP